MDRGRQHANRAGWSGCHSSRREDLRHWGPPQQQRGCEPVEVHDPSSDSWSTAANILTLRQFAAASDANGLVYAMGGDDGGTGQNSVRASVERYTPAVTVYRFTKN